MDSGWFKWQINIIGWSQNFREGQRLWRSSRDHSPSHTGDWPGEDPPPPWGLGLWALIQRPQTAAPWALSGDHCPHRRPSSRPACLCGQLHVRIPGRTRLIVKSSHERGRPASRLRRVQSLYWGLFQTQGGRLGSGWSPKSTTFTLYCYRSWTPGHLHLVFMPRPGADGPRLRQLSSCPGGTFGCSFPAASLQGRPLPGAFVDWNNGDFLPQGNRDLWCL